MAVEAVVAAGTESAAVRPPPCSAGPGGSSGADAIVESVASKLTALTLLDRATTARGTRSIKMRQSER
jgi:hypothetical protein